MNEVDNLGDLPLDLALKSRQDSVAQTLANHHVNVDSKDNSGKCLLHKAIKRGNFIFHRSNLPLCSQLRSRQDFNSFYLSTTMIMLTVKIIQENVCYTRLLKKEVILSCVIITCLCLWGLDRTVDHTVLILFTSTPT